VDDTVDIPFETVIFCASHWEHPWSRDYG